MKDFRDSKALRESLDELHAVRAAIYQQEKGLTLEQRVAKTRKITKPIIEKYGLKVLR